MSQVASFGRQASIGRTVHTLVECRHERQSNNDLSQVSGRGTFEDMLFLKQALHRLESRSLARLIGSHSSRFQLGSPCVAAALSVPMCPWRDLPLPEVHGNSRLALGCLRFGPRSVRSANLSKMPPRSVGAMPCLRSDWLFPGTFCG